MLRSVGIAAVVVGLAWTGLAGAQSSSPLEKARFINVSEEGKPPQRCKLLKTWHESNGAPVFQVQAVDSGEMMTIVGVKSQGGDSREMSTRIFRWGRDNKPPAGAPVPPLSATTSTTVSKPAAVQKSPPVAAQPVRPSPATTTPRTIPTSHTAQKFNTAPASMPAQPTSKSTTLTSSQPVPASVATKPAPVVSTKSPSLTPMSTQVVQYSPTTPPAKLPDIPSVTDSKPRLAPLPAGSVSSLKSGDCACSSPCEPCCKACNPCCQSSCVCGTPSPMRQPLMSRLFKSNSCNTCTTVVCQPTPQTGEKPTAATPPGTTVVTTIEPTHKDDWRQSWGKVEPWKASSQPNGVKAVEVSKRMDPKPVLIETPKQPDPLKAPDQYRDMVMSSRLANSKIPQEPQQHIVQPANAPPSTGMMRGQPIVISAEEPNAFWAPKSSRAETEQAKINAFDRSSETPQQPSAPPSFAGVRPPGPRPLPDIPGVAIPMLPPRAPVMNMPTPPLPATAVQRGPMVMMPDSGVPGAMGNAFTLPATSRPIPADFGGTPQEPNGFDPMARPGQGTAPRAYGMGMPGAYRQQMPNMMAMGPQAPMGYNSPLNMPSMAYGQAVVSASASTPSGSVPRLLATLKDSLRPSEREEAAEQLSDLNWRIQPLVVESLMKAAREDPAPTVRAACVHALAHMKVDTPAACALVRDLRSDGDPHVRQEAEEALHTLGDSGIQQASHK